MTASSRAKAALRKQFGGPSDRRGYVRDPRQNLVPGVRLEQFEGDLRRGYGNELDRKFCAVHSSAALAVNCFAPFKERPGDLRILGHEGAVNVEFERRLEIFSNRIPANLDVWIELGPSAIAVESKLVEYLQPKVPRLSAAYDQFAPPRSDNGWWTAFTDAKAGGARYLDRAQLLKHYFALRRLQESQGAKDLTLLYLFWEPSNWKDVPECRRHREEVEEFAQRVAGSSIRFRSMTYGELWTEWRSVLGLRDHAVHLKARYEVPL